jgi:hypothetical protein
MASPYRKSEVDLTFGGILSLTMPKQRRKKPTQWEQRVLDILLIELRRSVRNKRPLSITIDPFVSEGGAFIFAGQCESGHTYTVE